MIVNDTITATRPSWRFFGVTATVVLISSFVLSATHQRLKESLRFSKKALRGRPTPKPRSPLQVITFSDDQNYARYINHTNQMQCYSDRHGYKFVMLSPVNESHPCHQFDILFFQKHCVISYYLEEQKEDTWAVVLDHDVAPGAPNLSLDRWVEYAQHHDLDFVFYDRSTNINIMAGVFIMRNSQIAIGMMRYLVSFMKTLPPGYHNFDNGANHLMIVDALALEGRERCHAMYYALHRGGAPGYADWSGYIGCTKELLGPAGVYPIKDGGKRKGGLAIWPRFFFFAIDPPTWGFNTVRQMYPLHHAIKDGDWEKNHVRSYNTSLKCNNYTITDPVTNAELAERLRKNDETMLTGFIEDEKVIPRWTAGWLDHTCYDRLWCPPTPFSSKWPPADVNRTKKLYKRPRIEPVNPLIRRIESGANMLVVP